MDFEDFFDAFEGNEPAAEETPVVEETPAAEEPVETEPAAEGEEGTEGAEEPSDPAEEPAEAGAEAPAEEPAADDAGKEQKFTVRIGEEDREYSLEEMTDLARKGAGYDDLQAQLTQTEQARDQLQTQINEQQGVFDIMNLLSQKSGSSVNDIAKQLYINFRKHAGVSEDAAAMELENAQLKKQVEAATPAKTEAQPGEDPQARAKREVAEFRALHPGVRINDELVEKLAPDVQKGMSLANAYQKMINDQKAAELKEQERKAAAAAQNAKNKAASPGSQQDSGGRRQKSGVEDFFAQFK